MWGKLPGPWPVRLLIAVALALAVTLVLFTVVFPWLEPRLPVNDVTVDDARAASSVALPHRATT